MGMIVEGVSTTKAFYELAQQLEVEMPITETIYNVLYNDEDVQQAKKRNHVARWQNRKRIYT